MIIDWTPGPYTFDEADRYADPDLDSLEPIAEAWLTRDTDPEGILHGVGLHVAAMAAGLWADPVALVDLEPPCPVCVDPTSMGEPCDLCWATRIAA